MSETRFLRIWETSFQEVLAYELLRRGKEITLISQLLPTPKAAGLVLERMSTSTETVVREAAARLAGFLHETAPLDILGRLLRFEATSNLSEVMDALNAQEVVHAITMSAARFARSERGREAGLDVARAVVERTMDGGDAEFWTSSPYAMVTLVRHQAPGHRELLERWAAWANGPPPAYVAPVTLTNERGCARALLAGNENALRRVDDLLDKSDAEGMAPIPARMQPALDELLAAASEIG